MSAATKITPPNVEYRPCGAAYELLRRRDPEVLLSGPAGTGKSVACLWKLHYLATHVPGFRGLIMRKTRVSLTDSGLVTFERHVLPPGHPALSGPMRSHRQSYVYPGGGEIVVGGMDRASKVLSTEYDVVYIQEAIELAEEEWETLTTRLRNGAIPYQQMIADTNPDAPTHWLKRRCDVGKTVLLYSRHEDNPTLFDPASGKWSAFATRLDGGGYIDKLDALSGARYWRLRHGRWVQAEGVVYDGWDAAVHLLPRDARKITTDMPRYLSIDFGFTNPFVCQWWAKDHDGRLIRYREIYQTGLLVEDAARMIRELSKGEPVVAVVCDHDAEGRATLERYLPWRTTPAIKAVTPGIEAVAKRLRKAGDGKARLYLLRDSLVKRDPALVEAKLPCCTEEEMDGYVWDEKKEEPVKENDHGCDCLRYATAYHDLKAVGTTRPSVVHGGVRMPGR